MTTTQARSVISLKAHARKGSELVAVTSADVAGWLRRAACVLCGGLIFKCSDPSIPWGTGKTTDPPCDVEGYEFAV
jgi:hypothetical protein